jgi:hypothetical protein
MQVEWDEHKNLRNQRKHGISFEDAEEVFLDPLHVSLTERVVDGEQRWQTVGMIEGGLLLFVVHTSCEDDVEEAIRIISARRADRRERKRYEEGNG